MIVFVFSTFYHAVFTAANCYTYGMATEIYPVVHINDARQAREQAGVALEHGADGIYLIDHGTRTTDLLFKALNHTGLEYPESYIGINILCLRNAFDAFHLIERAVESETLNDYPDGLWVDDAHARSGETLALRSSNPELQNIRYLGGVAFKYTPRYTAEPAQAAEEAVRMSPYVDVVTTSGEETGIPPSAGKIKAMKEAIGNRPLAVASGVSIDNLADYEGLIDQLLVATSIETWPGSGVFDESKLHDLVQMAREL